MYSPSPIIIFHCNKSIECLLWKRTLLELLPCHVPHYFFFTAIQVVCFGEREGGREGWSFWRRRDYVYGFEDNFCLLLLGSNFGHATFGYQNFKEKHLRWLLNMLQISPLSTVVESTSLSSSHY